MYRIYDADRRFMSTCDPQVAATMLRKGHATIDPAGRKMLFCNVSSMSAAERKAQAK